MKLRCGSLESKEIDSCAGPTIQGSPETVVSDTLSISAAAEVENVDTIDGSDEAFLVKRVLKEALGNKVSDFKLLVFAVHTVILESVFVGVDQDSGMVLSCSHLLDDSPPGMISLRYTLPQILTNGASHSVNLKFQTLGHLVNVCGSLSDDVGSSLHCVCLDKRKSGRLLELMLASSESQQASGKEGFEMWKMVKDRLALPLLIDLCKKAGLDLPPCLMRLPMELKFMILERLSGVDLANVACTCSELRYLSSSDQLWKTKCEEEFGLVKDSSGFKFWFAALWSLKCIARVKWTCK